MGYLLRGSRAARSRFVRVFHALVCCGVAFGFRGSVSAQPVALRWEAPASCAEAGTVEAKIQALLGSQDQAPTEVQARVRIKQFAAPRSGPEDGKHARYRLKLWLTVGAHRATRSLHDESCDGLVDTVAWLIALAVNPEIAERTSDDSASMAAREARPSARAQESGPDGESAKSDRTASKPNAPPAPGDPAAAETAAKPSSPKPVAAAPPEVVQITAAAPPRRPWPKAGRAGAGAGMFSGGPGGVQAAVGAFAGLSVGWSYTQARFSGLLPRSVEIAPSASARIASLELDLTQCAMAGTRVRGGPCLSLSGLRTTANAKGLSGSSGNAALWAIASAGLSLFWRVRGHLELSLAASVGIPISPRPRFTVEGVGTVVSAEAWSSDLRLGLSFVSP